jgi:transcriptional regulator with XRE-family HTH domain
VNSIERATKVAIRGDRLLEAMQEFGWSQSDLARAIEVSPAAIQQIVTGKTKKSVHMPAIARAINVNLDWLLDVSEEKFDFKDSDENLDSMPLLSLTRSEFGVWVTIGLANFDRRVIPVSLDDKSNYAMFTELGDQWFPEFEHNACIVVDHNQIELRKPDDMWVAGDADRVTFLCRIRRFSNGKYAITDGADRAPVEVDPSSVNIVGRVIWATRLL